MTTTAADLAADLGVAEGDITVLLEQLGEGVDALADDLADDLAGFLRDVLDPHGERSTTGLYWPGTKPGRRRYGLGGPDPTAPRDDDLRR
jgi:hypothetical protein